MTLIDFSYKALLISALIFYACDTAKSKMKEEGSEVITLNNENLAEIKFINYIIDMGKVYEGDTLVASYVFKNVSENQLIIEYVNPDCICTDYYINKLKFSPGEEGEIKLILNTKNKVGRQKIYAVVKANTKVKFHRLLLITDVQ